MTTLVVGGAGYIGSHTSRLLQRLGREVIVLDDLCYGHEWAISGIELHKANVADPSILQFLRDRQITSVIYFAAFTYVGESVTDPIKYFQNNVSNMATFLSYCRDAGVKQFIFSSTCATYGNPIELPLVETHPQNPISPYGETKLFGEKMLQMADRAHGIKHVALRYFNACGADESGEIGEAHEPENHLIPLVLQAILGQRPHISVFGTDYDTPDGTAVRDYIHVNDLADAHVRALDYLVAGGDSTQINLGTGNGYSVKQIIEGAEKVTGRKVPTVFEHRREGDPPVLVANPQKSKEVLGWVPTHSSLENIIQTAWDWEQNRLKRGI